MAELFTHDILHSSAFTVATTGSLSMKISNWPVTCATVYSLLAVCFTDAILCVPSILESTMYKKNTRVCILAIFKFSQAQKPLYFSELSHAYSTGEMCFYSAL